MPTLMYQLNSFSLILYSIKLSCVVGFELDGYVNVALNKPVRQIHTGFDGEAHLANDGNTAGHYSQNQSCSHTNRTGDVWWMVDLLSTYQIQYIRIYNRVDKNEWFLTNFTVHVSLNNPLNDPDFSDELPGILCFNYTDDPPDTQSVDITCTAPIKGRYMYIWKSQDFLTLCEVEVLVKVTDIVFKEMMMHISDGMRKDESPFATVVSNFGSTACVFSCLSFQQSTTTIAQFDKATNICECIQYSSLTSDNNDNIVKHSDWTMYTLMSN